MSKIDIQFGMIVLYAHDLDKTIAFYRLLGLDISDPSPGRPVGIHRMRSGLSIIFTTGAVAVLYDASWSRSPGVGYQQVMEFVVGTDDEVTAAWDKLTSAGYYGRTAPGHINGPYAAMVDDPDGNAVLISSDIATLNGETPT